MPLREETSQLLAELRTLSGDGLVRADDVAVLLDLGGAPPGSNALQELGFLAKFLTRTYAIMARIGTTGNGYDGLLKEFNENLVKASALAQEVLGSAPPAVARHFHDTYFAMTQDAMTNFLALLHDLGWYKNWLLDHDRVTP